MEELKSQRRGHLATSEDTFNEGDSVNLRQVGSCTSISVTSVLFGLITSLKVTVIVPTVTWLFNAVRGSIGVFLVALHHQTTDETPGNTKSSELPANGYSGLIITCEPDSAQLSEAKEADGDEINNNHSGCVTGLLEAREGKKSFGNVFDVMDFLMPDQFEPIDQSTPLAEPGGKWVFEGLKKRNKSAH